MPINDQYSNPIEQSAYSSNLRVGIPYARTISVFAGRGQEVMECIQAVPINFGMVNTLPNLGPGPYGTQASGTGVGGAYSNTGTFTATTDTYPTLPYPATNPTGGSITGAANTNLTGTLATSTASTSVTGTGTLFQSQVLVGDVLYDVNAQVVIGTVASIASNTSLTLSANASETASAATVRTGDSIGTKYRIFNSVPAKYYLDDIIIQNPAIAGATGFQLGLYRGNYGVLVGNANALGTGLDLSTAHAYGAELRAANNLTLLQRQQPLWMIEGQAFDQRPNSYDLVLTSTVAPTATGIILVKAKFITPVS